MAPVRVALVVAVAMMVAALAGAQQPLQPAGQAPRLLPMSGAVSSRVKSVAGSGSDAAQIMGACYKEAVEQALASSSYVSISDRFDLAVALCSHALNGFGVLGKLATVDDGTTQVMPMLRLLQREIAASGQQDQAPFGKQVRVPPQRGTLHPRLWDTTANQAYHTNFFVTAGYVAGHSAIKREMVTLGNIFHETLDPNAWIGGGASREDFFASSMGAWIGNQLIMLRQMAVDGKNAAAVTLLPAAISGIVSEPNAPVPVVAGVTERQAQAAREIAKVTSDARDSWIVSGLVWYSPVNVAVLTARATSNVLSWWDRVKPYF